MTTQQVLESMVNFRATATDATFRQVYGEHLGNHLWKEFKSRCEYDLLRFYNQLDSINRALLAEALGPGGAFYIEPVCEECGQPLTGEDVAGGERICLDCGAALLLDGDDPLLATVVVR